MINDSFVQLLVGLDEQWYELSVRYRRRLRSPTGFVVIWIFLWVVATGWFVLCGRCVAGKGDKMAQFRTIVINVLRDQPSLLLCLFRQTSANVWELFAFVDGVFNELRLVCPTVAVRTKHRVIRRQIAVLFLCELVEFEQVFVVCLRLQFQESLGGVFNERFASLDAVIRETVFVVSVDFVSVCPSVFVGRTPQIDCVRVRCASLEVDEAHQLSREAKTCLF